MAVPAGPTEKRYLGNGVSTIFTVPFLVIQASDLAVYVDGDRLTSGYTQSGVGNPNSSVTFTTAPALNAQILLTLEVPFERLNDYQENGDFLADTVNNDFDRIWQALQQLLRYAGRALTLGQFDIDGQGWYRAKGNGIRDLRDPELDQDAATMGWTDRFVASLLSAVTGPINNAANIFYQGPDGSAHVVQDLSGPDGSALVGDGSGTIKSRLDAMDASQMVPVSKFGIFPDGVTNWESSPGADWAGLKAAALTTGVRWPAGETYGEYYACGINFDESWSGAKMHFEPGSVLGGVFHLISGGTMVQYQISSATRTSNVVTINTATPHGFVTGDKVQVRATYQTYAPGIVTMNTDGAIVTVTGPNSFTYGQTGPDAVATVAGSPLGTAKCNNAPLRDVLITGILTTTDRFGTINCKDCYIENVWVLNDPARHSAFPGLPARGAHLYVGTDGLRVDNMVIDYASGANTAAAFALDGNAWNPTNCSIGRLYVKDSAYNGIYITGGDHYFGEIRIDGFAKEAPNGEVLQDSNGIGQTNQFKGFWTNRCWGTRIDTLITSQRAQDGTRGFEYYHALIDQAGHPAYSTAERGVSIGRWEARNVRRMGIAIGDAAIYDSVNLQCDIEHLQISTAGEGLTAGAYCLDVLGASGQCDVNIGIVRLAGTGASFGVRVGSLATGGIGSIHAINHNNRILFLAGAMKIGLVKQMTTSGGLPTGALITIDGTGDFINGTSIDEIDLFSSITKNAVVFESINSARKWRVGILRSRGYRSVAGTVQITNPSQGFAVERFDLVGPDATGIAVIFVSGTVTNALMGGRIQGFAKGLDKGAATFTASSNAAVGMTVLSTVATDLAAASFDKLGCIGVTL